MIDPLDPPTDKEVTDINVSNNSNKFDRQNFLSLIDRVIFKKWHTKITLEFGLHRWCLALVFLRESFTHGSLQLGFWKRVIFRTNKNFF